MRSVDMGFRTDHALTAFYGLPQKQYSSQGAIDSFNTELLRKAGSNYPECKQWESPRYYRTADGDNRTPSYPRGLRRSEGRRLESGRGPHSDGRLLSSRRNSSPSRTGL